MKIKKTYGTAILNGNVVDSLEDNSTTNAPSQRAVNEALSTIAETGSTGNGSYIKFSDGTMICSALVTGTSNLSDYWGQFKRTNENIPVTFPVPFVNTPIVVATGVAYEGVVSVLIGDRLKDQFKFTALKPNANTGTNYAFLYHAVGKWK